MERLSCKALVTDKLKSDCTLLYNPIRFPSLKSTNYYILSNDEVRKPIVMRGSKESWIFFGIGSPHVLHALAEIQNQCDVQRIAFIDINPLQIGHLLRMVSWICESKDRLDFLRLLFCGKMNSEARQAIERIPESPLGSIRGAGKRKEKKNLCEIEEQFWRGFKLDVDRFRMTYGRDVEKKPGGLLTTQRRIGDINKCILTIVCGQKERYQEWPFTAGFGSGFLRDEQTFRKMQTTLQNTPISFIVENFNEFAEKFLSTYRYHPIALWTSNLFDDWFADRAPGIRKLHKSITKLGSQVEPRFPELELGLIQDERSTWPIPPELRTDNRRRLSQLSIHTRSFREVSRKLIGMKRLEIVNVPHWIEKDGGTSKLPCTDYILVSDIYQKNLDGQYNTLFLHILVGHGIPLTQFVEILNFLRNKSQRLLILEHHCWSPDFLFSRKLISPKQIRKVLGRENELIYIRGNWPWTRNFLMVYNESRR